MPLTAPQTQMPMPNAIMPFGHACEPLNGTPTGAVSGNLAAGTLTTTSVYAFPIVVWEPWTVKKASVSNGATVNGSWDIGVYTYDGATKLVSTGATTQTGVSQAQVASVTATTLAPGRYWMALGISSATATYARFSFAGNWFRVTGMMVHTVASSGSPLPASLTLAAPSNTEVIPLISLLDG